MKKVAPRHRYNTQALISCSKCRFNYKTMLLVYYREETYVTTVMTYNEKSNTWFQIVALKKPCHMFNFK